MERRIEFTDWHEEPYPLDMATEALDYLRANLTEFQELCALPGIQERCLNFVDTLQGHGGSFDFEPTSLAMLAELKIAIEICVLPSEQS